MEKLNQENSRKETEAKKMIDALREKAQEEAKEATAKIKM